MYPSRSRWLKTSLLFSLLSASLLDAPAAAAFPPEPAERDTAPAGIEPPQIAPLAQEFTLANGMKWVIIQKPGLSTVSGGWVAHVGSANERPGITGISHLFEHMMFKGSDRIGVVDAALDRQLNTALDEIREGMFEEEREMRRKVRLGQAESMSDPSLASPRYEELKSQFAELVRKQRENLIKDDFDKIYTAQGATGMNAFTNEDMTVYFISVPRNKLELWFWMESERLSKPVFREFYSERDVVFEERRMRTDSTPTGAQDEIFETLFWTNTTYNWPVVGWPSDIDSITREQASSYFDLFYAPNNITVCLVGDLDLPRVKGWAEAYFGRIPRGRENPPDVVTLPVSQRGARTFTAEVDSAPEVELRYHCHAFNSVDAPAMEILAEALSGKSGRLYKRLVLEEKLATRAGASFDGRKYAGSFSLFAEGKSDSDPLRLQQILLEELEKIKEQGIGAEELARIRNNLAGQSYRRLQNPFWLMVQVLIADGYSGDWRDLDRYQARLFQVKAEEVQQVAKKTFAADGLNAKRYTRKASAAVEDPDLAGLTQEQKDMVRQAWQQISQAPANALPDILAKIEAGAASAPAEMKPALEVLKTRLAFKIQSGSAQ